MIGGYLGEIMGLRGAIYVFGGGLMVAVVWLFLLGVWNIREIPNVAEDGESELADNLALSAR